MKGRKPKPTKTPNANPSKLSDRLVAAAQYEPDCICVRKPVKVICHKCSAVSFGRVQKICPCHPNVFYLMDFQYCPKCRQSCRFMEETKIAVEGDFDMKNWPKAVRA